MVPKRFNLADPGLVSTEEQVGKLRAAVAARTDPTTVIVARSAAFGQGSVEEAQERLRAYSTTGAEAVMLTGVRSREQLSAAHEATALPLCILAPPADARNDPGFLAENGVRILMLGNPTFAVAVKAMHDSLKHLRDGGALEELVDAQATAELLRSVNRNRRVHGAAGRVHAVLVTISKPTGPILSFPRKRESRNAEQGEATPPWERPKPSPEQL